MAEKKKKKSPLRFQLEIDEDQLAVLIAATEAYSRLHIGQMRIVVDSIAMLHDKRFKDHDDFYQWLEDVRYMANNLGMVFTRMPPNASFGIHSEQIPNDSRIAWDLYQVCRHKLSWTRNPKGDPYSVYYDDPYSTSGEKLAKCKLIEEEKK